eukprot:357479-Chlamydomonas_euryale.AAC.2
MGECGRESVKVWGGGARSLAVRPSVYPTHPVHREKDSSIVPSVNPAHFEERYPPSIHPIHPVNCEERCLLLTHPYTGRQGGGLRGAGARRAVPAPGHLDGVPPRVLTGAGRTMRALGRAADGGDPRRAGWRSHRRLPVCGRGVAPRSGPA